MSREHAWMQIRLASRIFFASIACCLAMNSIARGQDDDQIVIPMASYQDLLDRLDSVEAQVQNTGPSIPSRVSNGTLTSEGGYFSSLELVLLKPVYSNNTAFYTHDTLAGVTESAILTEFDFAAEASPRIEFGYMKPSSNIGWQARYWFFDASDSKDSADDADANGE